MPIAVPVVTEQPQSSVNKSAISDLTSTTQGSMVGTAGSGSAKADAADAHHEAMSQQLRGAGGKPLPQLYK